MFKVLVVLLVIMVTRPPRSPLFRTVNPLLHKKVNGPVPAAVVEKLAVEPWQTAWSFGFVVDVFCFMVSVAFLVMLPQVPVTVTVTACEPTLRVPVATLMLELSPLKGDPSSVHA
jgi:hypothetical protein